MALGSNPEPYQRALLQATLDNCLMFLRLDCLSVKGSNDITVRVMRSTRHCIHQVQAQDQDPRQLSVNGSDCYWDSLVIGL